MEDFVRTVLHLGTLTLGALVGASLWLKPSWVMLLVLVTGLSIAVEIWADNSLGWQAALVAWNSVIFGLGTWAGRRT